METEMIKKEAPKILIVDDISINVEILQNIIEHEGYETMCALSVKEALELIKQEKPTLILSDLSMPEMDGLEFCRILKSDAATRDIPFIFISILDTREEKERAFRTGAVDYIPKPFDAVEVIMRVNNQLERYRMKKEMEAYNRRMHRVVEDQKKQLAAVQKNVLFALAGILEKQSADMERHLENVGYNCRLLAQGLQFVPEYENEITDEFVEAVGVAARLHEIGSLVLQSSRRPGCIRQDAQQEDYGKIHAAESIDILKRICTGQNDGIILSMALRIAEYLYANWDGSGDPPAAGRDIPVEARIAAIADDFDELAAAEREKGGTDFPKEAMRMIEEKSGTYYDPDITDVLGKIRRRLRY